MLEQGELPKPEHVQVLVQPRSPEVPQMAALEINLALYDELLGRVGT